MPARKLFSMHALGATGQSGQLAKPQDVGSIRIHAGAGTTIMQLNDGRPNELGEQQLFEVEIMTDQEVATFPRGVQLRA